MTGTISLLLLLLRRRRMSPLRWTVCHMYVLADAVTINRGLSARATCHKSTRLIVAVPGPDRVGEVAVSRATMIVLYFGYRACCMHGMVYGIIGHSIVGQVMYMCVGGIRRRY